MQMETVNSDTRNDIVCVCVSERAHAWNQDVTLVVPLNFPSFTPRSLSWGWKTPRTPQGVTVSSLHSVNKWDWSSSCFLTTTDTLPFPWMEIKNMYTQYMVYTSKILWKVDLQHGDQIQYVTGIATKNKKTNTKQRHWAREGWGVRFTAPASTSQSNVIRGEAAQEATSGWTFAAPRLRLIGVQLVDKCSVTPRGGVVNFSVLCFCNVQSVFPAPARHGNHKAKHNMRLYYQGTVMNSKRLTLVSQDSFLVSDLQRLYYCRYF